MRRVKHPYPPDDLQRLMLERIPLTMSKCIPCVRLEVSPRSKHLTASYAACVKPRKNMSEAKLLACPFCGTDAVTEEIEQLGAIRKSVGCKTEGCQGYQSTQTYSTYREAAEAWNKRAGGRQPDAIKTPAISTLASAMCSAAGEYYILSIRHSPADGCAIWWRPKCAGYTTNLLEAGRYTEAEVEADKQYFNDGKATRAVKCGSVEAAIRLTVDWNVMLKAMKQQNDQALRPKENQ